MPKVKYMSSFNYGAGTITGAFMHDLANISYEDLSESASRNGLSLQQTPRVGFIDRLVVRNAFSLRAGVILMDINDDMWEEKIGMRPKTGVYGLPNLNLDDDEQLKQYSFVPEVNNFKFMAGVNDTDGSIGSNTSMGEDSYNANVNYESYVTEDYSSANHSNFENWNTAQINFIDNYNRCQPADFCGN